MLRHNRCATLVLATTISTMGAVANDALRLDPVFEPQSASLLPSGAENVFRGAKTKASGHWDDRVPTFAVDGRVDNASNHWSVEGLPAKLTLDLGGRYQLNTIHLWPYRGDGRYYQYLIEGSANGKDWMALGDQRQNTRPATAAGQLFQFPTREISLVRLTLTGCSAGDIAGNWHPELNESLDDYCMIVDHSIPDQALQKRRQSGQTTMFYVCCVPPRPNSFTFSPPAESTWMGWHAAARGYDGFLRWAYDSWTADPLHDTRHVHWPAGDCWLVYPGCRSSIRFERLREGIVDYEKLRILRARLCTLGRTAAVQELDNQLTPFTFEEAQASEITAKHLNAAKACVTRLTREAFEVPAPPRR